MTICKTMCAVAAVAGAVLATGAMMSTVSAQGYTGGEFRRFEGERHRFGPRCLYRVESHGSADRRLFGGGGGAQKAEARAINFWQSQVASNLGPEYANWAYAQAKSASCRSRGLLALECVVSANPCRVR